MNYLLPTNQLDNDDFFEHPTQRGAHTDVELYRGKYSLRFSGRFPPPKVKFVNFIREIRQIREDSPGFVGTFRFDSGQFLCSINTDGYLRMDSGIGPIKGSIQVNLNALKTCLYFDNDKYQIAPFCTKSFHRTGSEWGIYLCRKYPSLLLRTCIGYREQGIIKMSFMKMVRSNWGLGSELALGTHLDSKLLIGSYFHLGRATVKSLVSSDLVTSSQMTFQIDPSTSFTVSCALDHRKEDAAVGLCLSWGTPLDIQV